MREPRFLNEEQVRKHLRMEELIPAMEKALIDFSAGKVTQPVRSVITVDPPGGFFGLMPARTPEGLGLKIVTFYTSNAKLGIPTHMATIYLVDPETGRVLTMDYIPGLHLRAFIRTNPAQAIRNDFATKIYVAWARLYSFPSTPS